jgi:hypothetical protein
MTTSLDSSKVQLRSTALLNVLKTLFPLEKDWSAHRLNREVNEENKNTYKYAYVTVTWIAPPDENHGQHLYEIAIDSKGVKDLLDALKKSGVNDDLIKGI